MHGRVRPGAVAAQPAVLRLNWCRARTTRVLTRLIAVPHLLAFFLPRLVGAIAFFMTSF